jgi:hypothetical protein
VAKASGGGDRLVARRDRRITSTSFIAGRRVEEVDAAEADRLGAVSIAISITGSVDVLVARMRPGLDGSSSSSEQRLLRGEVLDDRLDDEVAVGEVCDPLGAAHPTEHGVAVLFAQPTLVDLALQGLLEPGDRGVGGRLVA